VGNFTIYAIQVGKWVWKVGKADSDRTRASGTPDRIAQQVKRLEERFKGKFDVSWIKLSSLKNVTTKRAKEIEQTFVNFLESPQNSTKRSKL
jgi:hypothetical protein